MDLSNVLMDKYVAESNLETYIPNMVKEIVKANTLFSVAGIGPISKNSLPFYAGRYIDKVSGRIRVLPNPTSKYINPLSYKARMSYLQARILNNWNKYVQS